MVAALRDGALAPAPLGHLTHEHMRASRRAALAVAVLLAACGDPSAPPADRARVPHQIVLSHPSLTVDDDGSAVLTARVLDQSGAAMDTLPAGVAIAWRSRDSTVATVTDGVVRALRPGQTYAHVAAGALRDSAMVTVVPVASRLQVVAGGDQRGNALQLLREDVAVRVLDRHGTAVPGAAVAFAVVDGDGTLSAEHATTDALGAARVRWTLGPRTGAQRIRASLLGARPAEALVAAAARPQLLVSRQGSALTLINLENSDETVLFSQWAAMDAAWSPDGRRIAFAGRPDNLARNRIYVMNADGTGAAPITAPDPGNDAEVDWSPDGSRLVFTRVLDGGPRVFAVDPDGRNLARLTNATSSAPRWSPDGARIALRLRSATHPSMEIAVMNSDGTGVRTLTENETDDEGPDWSPDGARLVYHGWREGRPRLFVVNADGTGDRLLTTAAPPNHLYDADAAWSRDGGVIAFSRATMDADGASYSSGVYTIRPDGTGLTPGATGRGATDSPRWRP